MCIPLMCLGAFHLCQEKIFLIVPRKNIYCLLLLGDSSSVPGISPRTCGEEVETPHFFFQSPLFQTSLAISIKYSKSDNSNTTQTHPLKAGGTMKHSPNSFNEASITLIIKPICTVQERNLQARLTHEHRSTHPKHNTSK